MAKHTELVRDPESPSGARFCLDSVLRDDEDNRREFAFVWRGTVRSPEGFQARPAYFDWPMLGRTIREAIATKSISPQEADAFFRALMGIAP